MPMIGEDEQLASDGVASEKLQPLGFSNDVAVEIAAYGDRLAMLTDDERDLLLGNIHTATNCKSWTCVASINQHDDSDATIHLSQFGAVGLGDNIVVTSKGRQVLAFVIRDDGTVKHTDTFNLMGVTGKVINSVAHLACSGAYVSMSALTQGDAPTHEEADSKPAAVERDHQGNDLLPHGGNAMSPAAKRVKTGTTTTSSSATPRHAAAATSHAET